MEFSSKACKNQGIRLFEMSFGNQHWEARYVKSASNWNLHHPLLAGVLFKVLRDITQDPDAELGHYLFRGSSNLDSDIANKC